MIFCVPSNTVVINIKPLAEDIVEEVVSDIALSCHRAGPEQAKDMVILGVLGFACGLIRLFAELLDELFVRDCRYWITIVDRNNATIDCLLPEFWGKYGSIFIRRVHASILRGLIAVIA